MACVEELLPTGWMDGRRPRRCLAQTQPAARWKKILLIPFPRAAHPNQLTPCMTTSLPLSARTNLSPTSLTGAAGRPRGGAAARARARWGEMVYVPTCEPSYIPCYPPDRSYVTLKRVPWGVAARTRAQKDRSLAQAAASLKRRRRPGHKPKDAHCRAAVRIPPWAAASPGCFHCPQQRQQRPSGGSKRALARLSARPLPSVVRGAWPSCREDFRWHQSDQEEMLCETRNVDIRHTKGLRGPRMGRGRAAVQSTRAHSVRARCALQHRRRRRLPRHAVLAQYQRWPMGA